MLIKGIIDEDFVNYKKPSMFIAFPICSFKCNSDYGDNICQNYNLFNSKSIKISYIEIVNRYLHNDITHAVVMGGLEPFDSFNDLHNLVSEFRKYTNDDIVIYSGYKESEINHYVDILKPYRNIIIKYGRYIPNRSSIYDELLGVTLISSNQYSKLI